MRGLVILVCLAFPAIAYGGPTAALVTYESTNTDPQGVTHTIRYQERIVRDESNVWVVRVLQRPESRVNRAHDLDLVVAARWYRRDGNGVKVTLVSLANKIAIEVGAESFETLGLATRWQDVPDPARVRGAKVVVERVTQAPWLQITSQFQRLELSDRGD